MRRACTLIAILVALACALPGPASADFGLLPGSEGFDPQVLSEGGQPASQAGSHPTALSLDLNFALQGSGPLSDGDLRDLSIELPPGLIENSTAVPRCSADALRNAPRLALRTEPLRRELPGPKPGRHRHPALELRRRRDPQPSASSTSRPLPGMPSAIGFSPYGAPIVLSPRMRQAEGELRAHPRGPRTSPRSSTSPACARPSGEPPGDPPRRPAAATASTRSSPPSAGRNAQVGRPSQNPATAYLTLPTSCEGPLTFTRPRDLLAGGGRSPSTARPPPSAVAKRSAFAPEPLTRLGNRPRLLGLGLPLHRSTSTPPASPTPTASPRPRSGRPSSPSPRA